jgi:AraC-like DNA-binding protein
MNQTQDILQLSCSRPVLLNELELLSSYEKQIPGSVHYSIMRYSSFPGTDPEDLGIMVYHYRKEDTAANFLELKFCLSGQVYCRQKNTECDSCKLNPNSLSCPERQDSMDLLSFRFSPAHLSQNLRGKKTGPGIAEEILSFRHPNSFSKTLPLCSRSRLVLEALLNHNYTGSMQNIFVNAQIQMLLLYSMECMVSEKEGSGFQCKFLATEDGQEKILNARQILLKHIGDPLTIRELSRKVAINECYLKKGFKEMFGMTIFEFYQSQRMEHARYLLYEKGLNVTDVSVLLGYSSISHFSTAFKKHTGLKPCELLLR